MDRGHFTIFRRGNGFYYYYVYDDNGGRIKKSTGKKTKAKAQAFILEQIKKDLLFSDDKKIRLRDFCDGFWDFDTSPVIQGIIARGGHCSMTYAKQHLSNTEKYILKELGDRFLRDLTTSQIQSWIISIPKKYEVSNKTANAVLTTLRAILDEARKQRLIPSNPATEVKPLVKNSKRRECFTLEEVNQLFSSDWCNLSMKAACLLSAKTGMRLGEIRALTLEQLHDDYINVDASWADAGEGRKTTKSGYGRIVACEPKMIELLRKVAPMKEGLIFTINGVTPVCRQDIAEYLTKQLVKAKVTREGLTFHSFRHFFNTRLVASGLEGAKIRATIGHESEEMTEHYCHLDSKDLESVRKIQETFAKM